jgi:hypothetical protein
LTTIGLAAVIQAPLVRHHSEWRLRCGWRNTIFVFRLDVVLVAGIAT